MLEPEKKFKKRKSSSGSTLFPVLFQRQNLGRNFRKVFFRELPSLETKSKFDPIKDDI